ncbi:MAG: ribonuclease HII [Kiritimatiellae bacterium]|nr:ribonuclease HII [Kiritimatiellia bacterium]
MREFESAAYAAGHRRPAGVDEAGRGPLAGPVVAACVVLPGAPEAPPTRDSRWDGLTDSKRLTSSARVAWLTRLRSTPGVAIGIGWATVAEIARLNILRATHLAMRRAVARVRPPPDYLLVDGRPVPGLPCAAAAIVRGDQLCLSIAAASVVAKVVRDRYMERLERRHPGYGFAQHKGYGTPAHLDALRRLGPCPAHRLHFRPVARLAGSAPIR